MTNEANEKRDTRWDETAKVSDDIILPDSVSDIGSVMEELAQQIGEDRTICEERVEVNRLIDQPADIRREEDATVIPVMREQLVLVKKLVITEEIRLYTVPPEEDC